MLIVLKNCIYSSVFDYMWT